MRREFGINIAFLLFINLLIKPFFIFGIDLTVQNRTGEDYGLYFALFNFAYLFQIFNDFGIQNFNNQALSQDREKLSEYFPNLLALKAGLGFFYFVLTVGAAWFLAGYRMDALPLLGVLLINQIIIQFIFFYRSNISGTGHYRADSVLSALDKLLMIAFCGFLLWVNPLAGEFGIYHFALAQTAALLLTLVFAVAVFRHFIHIPIKIRVRREFVWKLLRESIPFALVILLMGAFSRFDGVLLERMLPQGKYHAEIYAGAYRLLDAAGMIGYLFASLLLPMFSRMLKNGDAVGPLVRLSVGLLWCGSLVLALMVYHSRHFLVELMYHGGDYAYRAAVLGAVFWSFLPICLTYVFGALLSADRQLERLNRFFVLAIVLNLGLCFYWIPNQQAAGAAYSAVITQSFVGLGTFYLCLEKRYFQLSELRLWPVLWFSIGIIAWAWFVFSKTAMEWWLQALCVALAGLVGLLLLFWSDIVKSSSNLRG